MRFKGAVFETAPDEEVTEEVQDLASVEIITELFSPLEQLVMAFLRPPPRSPDQPPGGQENLICRNSR
jgi:hypothetical protein